MFRRLQTRAGDVGHLGTWPFSNWAWCGLFGGDASCIREVKAARAWLINFSCLGANTKSDTSRSFIYKINRNRAQPMDRRIPLRQCACRWRICSSRIQCNHIKCLPLFPPYPESFQQPKSNSERSRNLEQLISIGSRF